VRRDGEGTAQVARVVRGFALACHPAPAVTVTLAVTALAAAAGRDAAGCVLVMVTVFVGQLSVGWSNDALDAPRDVAVGRMSKPVVAGLVSRRALGIGAVVALAVSAVLSFLAAGLAGGACHVLFLASAWAYNLGIKSTVFSLVPYAVGFGALPGFVTFGLTPSVPPQTWAVVTAGLLGVAAGLANAAPDVDDDSATGVRGAVGRMGPAAARTTCVVVLLIATVVLVTGAGLSTTTAVVAMGVIAVLGAVGLRARGGALLFPLVLVIALLDVALLVGYADRIST